jgi:hypothetical protein
MATAAATSMAPIRNSDIELRQVVASSGSSKSSIRGISIVGRIAIALIRACTHQAGAEAELVGPVGRVSGGGDHLHRAHNATASNETSPPGGPPRAHGQGSATDDNRVGVH